MVLIQVTKTIFLKFSNINFIYVYTLPGEDLQFLRYVYIYIFVIIEISFMLFFPAEQQNQYTDLCNGVIGRQGKFRF